MRDTFQQLAKTQAMLRPAVPAATPDMDATKRRVLQRLHDGYSLTRYRTQTGEETAALLRGPLVPTDPVKPAWELLSTSGSDLQILDKELGMMDLTYSSAWQLGRTLALADRAFATALTRVRREIAKQADHAAQASLLQAADRPFHSRVGLAASVGSSLEQLAALSRAEDVATRWVAPVQDAVDLSRTGAGVAHFRHESLREAARAIASADEGAPELRPYNEFNTPRSVDWAVLLKFVMDLYHLNNVPPHYLLTDPSHVPAESLRFFVVDQAWIDACVDGALSLGNHDSRERDGVRAAIKDELNRFLELVDPDVGYKPPVPRLGFVLRSEIVTKFPDLQIAVATTKPAGTGDAPKLVRTMQLAEGMLMAFLSEAATGSADETLTLTVPAHQQYFTAAAEVAPRKIDLSYKRIYTSDSTDVADARSKPVATPSWDRGVAHPEKRPVPFVWGSDNENEDVRLVLVEHLARDVFKTLTGAQTDDGKEMFKEAVASSAMMGIQLNSAAWQLKVKLPELKPPPNWSSLSNARALTITGEPPVEKRLPKRAAQKTPASFRQRVEKSALSHMPRPPPHHQGVVWMADDKSSRRGSSSSWGLVSEDDDDAPHGSLQAGVCLLPELEPPKILAEPKWNFAVWAADSRGSSEIKMLETRQDLIFSIVVEKGTEGDFLIERADITFDMDTDSSLMEGYYGAGASMVSNLRYNVRLVAQGNQFRLPILPRSTVDKPPRVPVKKTTEMSVFLPGVKVRCADWKVNVKFTLHLTYIIAPVKSLEASVQLMPQLGGCPPKKGEQRQP